MNIDNLDKFHTFVPDEVINYNQINNNNDIIINALKSMVSVVSITQEDYDNLETKDPNVLYCIIA